MSSRLNGPSILRPGMRFLPGHGFPLGPAPRAELLHVLTLLDFERVGAIQSYWSNPKTRSFGEPLIDCEEDRTLRAMLIGMLREMDP